MASSAGMWDSEFTSASYNHPFVVESILASIVANGLGRTTYNSTMVGRLKGSDPEDPWTGGPWLEEMFPRRTFGFGRSVYDVDPSATATSTMLTMQATVRAYAYSPRGIVQKVALGVILTYVVLALAHTGYSGWTGWTSTSWGTAPELLALAMKSQAAGRLYNTGAGIDTVTPFKERVRIRQRNGHLEFIFNDTIDGACSVRPNVDYS
jgi:hypothetical protein